MFSKLHYQKAKVKFILLQYCRGEKSEYMRFSYVLYLQERILIGRRGKREVGDFPCTSVNLQIRQNLSSSCKFSYCRQHTSTKGFHLIRNTHPGLFFDLYFFPKVGRNLAGRIKYRQSYQIRILDICLASWQIYIS